MDFNKVILAGRLTRDVELIYAQGGDQLAVGKFGLAVNRRWTTKTGEKQEEVCFVDCVAFGRTAETLNEFKRKGDTILVEGHLKLDQWEDRETGKPRSKIEVVAERIAFGSDRGQPQGGDQGGAPRDERRQEPQGRPREEPRGQQGGRQEPPRDEVSFDDIPFSLLFALTGTALAAIMGA